MRSAYHIRNVEVFRLKQLAADPPQVAEMKFARKKFIVFSPGLDVARLAKRNHKVWQRGETVEV